MDFPFLDDSLTEVMFSTLKEQSMSFEKKRNDSGKPPSEARSQSLEDNLQSHHLEKNGTASKSDNVGKHRGKLRTNHYNHIIFL